MLCSLTAVCYIRACFCHHYAWHSSPTCHCKQVANQGPQHGLMSTLHVSVCRAASSSPDMHRRAAAMMVCAVLAEGCSEALRKRLPQVLPLLLAALQDPEGDVRGVAAFALGQFSEYLQPEILEHYQEVMPGVFRLLGDPNHDVQERACYGELMMHSRQRQLASLHRAAVGITAKLRGRACVAESFRPITTAQVMTRVLADKLLQSMDVRACFCSVMTVDNTCSFVTYSWRFHCLLCISFPSHSTSTAAQLHVLPCSCVLQLWMPSVRTWSHQRFCRTCPSWWNSCCWCCRAADQGCRRWHYQQSAASHQQHNRHSSHMQVWAWHM